MNYLIPFLSGIPVKEKDKIMHIETIWHYKQRKLETDQNYIHWLFPLPDKNENDPFAPVLTKEDITTIKNSPTIQDNLIFSLECMLRFYGFELCEETITVKRTKSIFWMCWHWLKYPNRNYRRITRILKCLNVCGLNEYSKALYQALINIKAVRKIAPDESLKYWANAIKTNGDRL